MPVTTPAKMHLQRLKSSSMTTLLFSHPACEDHIPDLGHPENPGRLRAIAQALADGEFGALLRREAPRAEEEQIARVHSGSSVPELLANMPADGVYGIDPDTYLSPGSGERALRAAGGVVAAGDAVMAGGADRKSTRLNSSH